MKLFSFIQTVQASNDFNGIGSKLQGAGGVAGTTEVADVSLVIGDTIGIALSFLGVFFLLFTLYAGYLWMTAQGDEEKVSKAQKILRGTAAGLLIVVAAYAISFTVLSQYSSGRSLPSSEIDEDLLPGEAVGCCQLQGETPDLSVGHEGKTAAECDAIEEQAGGDIYWHEGACVPQE